jgi:DNA modification methylase
MAKCKLDTGKTLFDPTGSVPQLPKDYYAANKPNTSLRNFVVEHSSPYDPDDDQYSVETFTEAITTSKVTAIYNMHSYWSKKPHEAIDQYIDHFTSKGDLVLDPFCGSGGTNLSAMMAGRATIAIDRSPAATFITKNYCTPTDPSVLWAALAEFKKKAKAEIDWLYETKCDRCNGKALIDFTVYSQVFQCKRCLEKVPLFDCEQVDVVTLSGRSKTVNVCPHCYARGHSEVIRSQSQKFGAVPVLISYTCHNGCDPRRSERRHKDADSKKRTYFEKCDLAKLRDIESKPIPYPYPRGYDMTAFSRYQRDALMYYGVTEVSHLFTKRNLWALAIINNAASTSDIPGGQDILRFAFTALLLRLSRMNQYRPEVSYPTSILSGTFYLPQVSVEAAVWDHYVNKVERLIKGYTEINARLPEKVALLISTQSSAHLSEIPANTIDYIFTDPPYADKVQYGELNFVWEAWLGLDTSWHDEEIIVNEIRGKYEADWAQMMKRAMAECYRVLKPGRWLSLCYHDTSAGTWGLIQDIMAESGFIVDKSESTLFIDTGGKTFNQINADTVTKRDLILNFRKPKPDEWRIVQIFIPDNLDIATFHELGRQVIKDFLVAQPGATKDRIYDALISSMVRKGQMESHDFDALLESVAEEVQQPVKEDLFRDKEPDLFGSHVQSRWYLKETADQVDHAEQAKEDAAAAHLS